MPGDTQTQNPETTPAKEIRFKCKFCGESKPLNELIMMRQYYPQIPVCKKCAAGPKKPDPAE